MLVPVNLCMLGAILFVIGTVMKMLTSGVRSEFALMGLFMLSISLSLVALNISVFASEAWLSRTRWARCLIYVGLALGIFVAIILMSAEGIDGAFRQPMYWLFIYFVPLAFALNRIQKIVKNLQAKQAIEADA